MRRIRISISDGDAMCECVADEDDANFHSIEEALGAAIARVIDFSPLKLDRAEVLAGAASWFDPDASCAPDEERLFFEAAQVLKKAICDRKRAMREKIFGKSNQG